jgi:serine phosphatase RsbU (regulator of sigma subunit)
MKASIILIGLSKVAANQIKKELVKCTSKNSFELFQVTSAEDALKKIEDEPALLVWEEVEDENSYKYFKELKKKFPKVITILISTGKIETIVNEVNLNGLFRVIRSPHENSDIVKYLEEALIHWMNLQNQNKKISGNDKETLQKELLIAQEIQKNLLPTDSPKWKNLEIVCFSESAKNVGGDLYTYYGMQNDRTLISKHLVAVGDVSGKGISAALLMATCISHIDNTMKLNLKLPERMAYLDKLLVPFTKPQKQNCALCMVELVGVNTNHAFAKIVNAACIPPYVKRKNGSVEWISAKGFALGQGIGSQFGYKEATVAIEKGDMLILVSDGIIEANNESNDLLGFERFARILESGPHHSSKEMLAFIQKNISEFTNQYEQHDDMTIVVIRYH